MAHGRNKYQSRESRARVRAIFLHEWDPIGVKDSPAAADEYDTYADKAYVMLMDENASAQTISDYLFYIASDYMGLSVTNELKERCGNVAELLVSLRPSFLTH